MDNEPIKEPPRGGQITFPLDEWVSIKIYADRIQLTWQQLVRLAVREFFKDRPVGEH